MSDPSSIPGFGPVDQSTLGRVSDGTANFFPSTKKSSSGVTKKDVNELIASFAPAEAPQQTAAEKERASRKARLSTKVRALVADLQALGVDSGTPADAAAAFKALKTVETKAHAAIDSLREQHLGIEPTLILRTARAPRSKPAEPRDELQEIIDSALETGEAEVLTPENIGEVGTPSQRGEETPAQMDSRIAAERIERGAPTRSGPPASAPAHQDGF